MMGHDWRLIEKGDTVLIPGSFFATVTALDPITGTVETERPGFSVTLRETFSRRQVVLIEKAYERETT